MLQEDAPTAAGAGGAGRDGGSGTDRRRHRRSVARGERSKGGACLMPAGVGSPPDESLIVLDTVLREKITELILE